MFFMNGSGKKRLGFVTTLPLSTEDSSQAGLWIRIHFMRIWIRKFF